MDVIVNGRFLTQRVTGVQRYARELMHALDILLESRSDINLTLLSPPLEGDLPNYKNIVHQTEGRFKGHAWEQLELPWLSRGQLLFCPGNTAPLLSLLGRQRVVTCVHDLSYRYFPDAYSQSFRLVYEALIPMVLRKSDAVITVSESERRSIIEHYPFSNSRLTVIQNGGLLASELKTVTLSQMRHKHPCVLYVGSLSKRKNFPGVFEVACRLARKRGIPFIFVGGTPDGISETAHTVPEDLRHLITFAGQIDNDSKLIEYYQSALCLLFPSFYEASPLPPIEAMSCGCPVIAASIPSLQERCGDAAYYCDPYDIDAIVESVEQLVDDIALREALRRKGLERATQYTWERCARQTLDVFTRVA